MLMSQSLAKGNLTLYHSIPIFDNPEKRRAFENIEGKEENAGDQHFLLFPQCFLPFSKQTKNFFLVTFILSSANTFNLDWSKIQWFGKEVMLPHHPW